MELVQIKLNNFRGYRNIVISLSNGLQMLLGKNDIGKSTIFEALDIFFNDKEASVKISIDDLNISAKKDSNMISSISCSFALTDDDMICVETLPVNLNEEYLTNAEGLLEVVKEWDFSNGGNPKATTFLICNIPDAIPCELLTAKQADLKRKVKELNIEDNVNQTQNSSMRKGIFTALLLENGAYSCKKIPTKNMLAEKDIFENISKSFPDFYLFKADRKNSTADDEIQNPMNIAVKRAFETEEIKAKIQEIETIVKKQLNEVNEATIEKLKDLNVDYGSQLLARISTNWTSAVKNDIIDGNEIPINKRGSGIRRLLLLSYLMVEAEKKSFDRGKKNIIFAIEEPETALHPIMQTKFISQLITLSKENRCEFGDEMPSNADEGRKYQILITTHLPNFVAYARPEQIIYLHKNPEGVVERYSGTDLKDFIQKEMGKIPVIDYKYVMFVEGDNDVEAFRHFSKIPELKATFDLNADNVNIIPLKGGNLLKCVEMDYYWKLPVKQYHLYDGDIPKYKTEVIDARCNKDDNKNIRGTVTTLKELENYIPCNLLETKLGLDLSDYREQWHNDDFNIVEVLLAQSDTSVPQFNKIKAIKESTQKIQAMKSYLNKTILKGVTKQDLETHGVYSEVEGWFKAMKELSDYVEV